MSISIFTRNAVFRKYDIQSSLDHPETTIQHREIIFQKSFLKRIYLKWYNEIYENVTFDSDTIHLELGSGGGFLKDVFPHVLTSDLLDLPYVDKKINAESLPFHTNTISSISMLNVFHHIPRPYLFLAEAQRVLVKGGRIIMIEPANTPFSRFIYKNFHHELFDVKGSREIQAGAPLSNSNQALPYIYFLRDVKEFDAEFSKLRITKYRNHTPFLYILSGGVSRTAMVPAFSFSFFNLIEKIFSPFNNFTGLFSTIVIQKVDE